MARVGGHQRTRDRLLRAGVAHRSRDATRRPRDDHQAIAAGLRRSRHRVGPGHDVLVLDRGVRDRERAVGGRLRPGPAAHPHRRAAESATASLVDDLAPERDTAGELLAQRRPPLRLGRRQQEREVAVHDGHSARPPIRIGHLVDPVLRAMKDDLGRLRVLPAREPRHRRVGNGTPRGGDRASARGGRLEPQGRGLARPGRDHRRSEAVRPRADGDDGVLAPEPEGPVGAGLPGRERRPILARHEPLGPCLQRLQGIGGDGGAGHRPAVG